MPSKINVRNSGSNSDVFRSFKREYFTFSNRKTDSFTQGRFAPDASRTNGIKKREMFGRDTLRSKLFRADATEQKHGESKFSKNGHLKEFGSVLSYKVGIRRVSPSRRVGTIPE